MYSKTKNVDDLKLFDNEGFVEIISCNFIKFG